MPKRTAKQLSEPGIKKMAKAKPGQRREVYDKLAPGLALRVTDRGTKTWAVHYRYAGKHQRITLGEWPSLKVEGARTTGREIRDWAKGGVDPKTALKIQQRARAEAREVASMTFGDLAAKYIEQKIPELANASRYEAVIRTRLISVWGDLTLYEMRGHHLSELVAKVKAEAGPMAAYRVYEVGKGIFTWALGASVRGVDSHPFAHVRAKHLSIKKVPRTRLLKEHEISLIWPALESLGYPFGPWAQLLLLLAQRSSEVATMERKPGELDLDKAQWIIPSHKNKSKRQHVVPLPPSAVAILWAVPEFSGGKFVFSTTNGERPISGFGKVKARIDDAVSKAIAEAEQGADNIEPWTWHDLRRTGSTEMARLGVPEIVRDRVLNHLPQGLEKTYNLYGYLDEKRDALSRWAQEVQNITEPPPENVVKLNVDG